MHAPIRTAQQAAAWLEGLINVERRPDLPYKRLGLEPIRALLEAVGRPDAGLSVLHVAGSKGKGSTALLAEGILTALGLRTGVFTSPHLERWTERFRVDAAEVEGERLAEAVERIRPHVERLRAGPPERVPSFFDAITAAALVLFAQARVDHVVLEVGLGGRLDSTNAVRSKATCITAIELEHTEQLGDTLAAIAGEKAGIIEPGIPLVTGALPAEAAAVVAARASELGAPLSRLGREVELEDVACEPDGTRFRVRDAALEGEFRIEAAGLHQAANAALALACTRRLLGEAVAPEQLAAAARTGLPRVALPGRIELLDRRPWVVVDSAHTAASARALSDHLGRIPYRRLELVLSISAGKDTRSILEALLPHASSVSVTRAEASRSLSPSEIAEAVRRAAPGLPLRVVPNPHLAIRAARESLGEADALCVTGSVYLAGIARRVLRDVEPPARVAVTRSAGGGRSPVAGS